MKKIIITIAVLLGFAGTGIAQHTHFTTSGTVEFERRTNVYAMIKKEINKDNEAYLAPALDAYKKSNPQFRVLKSTLSFMGNKTLFNPVEADPVSGLVSGAPLMNQNNTIYTDFNSDMSVSQRKVFDETFLVKDSIRKIKWKITDETREIAGYICRRANGIMLDSIYVVAFFTGKIPISGGPESFNGLPGMILEVALPHENVIWVATKVTDNTLLPNAVNAPNKGKALDNKGLKETLFKASKDWGDVGRDFIKGFLL